MILKTRQAGDPALRKKAKQLSVKEIKSARIQSLIDDMVETLRDNPGVGLAAPQVGENLQIIIIEDLAKYHKRMPKKLLAEQGRSPVKLHVLINPELKSASKKNSTYFEGCLSVDGYRALVTRSLNVSVIGHDRHGKKISISGSGWFARVLQHEIDHLDGKIYIDKM